MISATIVADSINSAGGIPIDSWRRPGCDARCWPRSHSADAHEAYGGLLERERRRSQIVRTGALAVNLDTCTATVNGREIPLTEREWALLAYLAQHAGRWLTWSEIVRDVWSPEHARFGAPTTISTLRSRLQAKLGSCAWAIETVSGGNRRRSSLTRLALAEVAP